MSHTTNYYTREQVVESYKARCRMYNLIAKKVNPDLVLHNGLTDHDIIVVGDLLSSLPETEKVMPFSQLYDNSQPLFIGA